jgi:hypothetical protein
VPGLELEDPGRDQQEDTEDQVGNVAQLCIRFIHLFAPSPRNFSVNQLSVAAFLSASAATIL